MHFTFFSLHAPAPYTSVHFQFSISFDSLNIEIPLHLIYIHTNYVQHISGAMRSFHIDSFSSLLQVCLGLFSQALCLVCCLEEEYLSVCDRTCSRMFALRILLFVMFCGWKCNHWLNCFSLVGNQCTITNCSFE